MVSQIGCFAPRVTIHKSDASVDRSVKIVELEEVFEASRAMFKELNTKKKQLHVTVLLQRKKQRKKERKKEKAEILSCLRGLSNVSLFFRCLRGGGSRNLTPREVRDD
jgi:hypothetical protein